MLNFNRLNVVLCDEGGFLLKLEYHISKLRYDAEYKYEIIVNSSTKIESQRKSIMVPLIHMSTSKITSYFSE